MQVSTKDSACIMPVDCHAEQPYLAAIVFLKYYGIFPGAVGHEAGKLANNTLVGMF